MTKLTLSLEEEVVATAKRLAKRHRTSVSAMLANMVKAMAVQEEGKPLGIPPDSMAAKALGLATAPAGKSDDEVLYEALCDKYGIEPK